MHSSDSPVCCRYDSDNISLLWESVDSLISGWYSEMLKTKDVACVHCLKERSYDPYLFSMDDLELTVATGKQYVYCRGIHPVRIGTCLLACISALLSLTGT